VVSTLTYQGILSRTDSFAATGETEITTPPQAMSVTIVKYLDGRQEPGKCIGPLNAVARGISKKAGCLRIKMSFK